MGFFPAFASGLLRLLLFAFLCSHQDQKITMSGCDSYVTAWGFKKGPKSAESSQRCFAVIMPVTGNIASSQGQEPLLPCDMLGNGLALLLLRLIISPWEALLPYGKVKILLSSAAGAT